MFADVGKPASDCSPFPELVNLVYEGVSDEISGTWTI